MENINHPIDLEMQLLSSPPVDNHGGGSTARQVIQTSILVLQSVQVFLDGNNHGSPPDHEHDEHARNEDIEEVAVECANEDDQTALPLLNTLNNTLYSRKPIRKLVCVVQSFLAFKALKGKQEASACLPDSSEHHVSIDQTPVNQIHGNRSKNIKNLSTIVRQKNLSALEEFGGLSGVESALSTDLINGISKNEALNRCQPKLISTSPTHTFFHLVRKEVKKTTIILLLLAVILSTVLGINEEGVKYGCYNEVVVLIAIILLVFFASIRKYLEEKRTKKKLHKHQFKEWITGDVDVKRGDEIEKINESQLVFGDLVLLKKDDEVPCDGLFVDGEELLELDYGGESCIINKQNPFLSYGGKVINGDAKMVVTSTNMETEWGEMMSKAMSDQNQNTRFKLLTQLDKLNTYMHHIQIIISILVVLVLASRFIAGKIDDQNGFRIESLGEPTSMRSFSNTFVRIIKESKYTTKVVTKLLSVSLVGLTEGVPFVVSLAIFYWNDKTLYGKAIEQDPHCVAKMASVTRICTDSFIIEDDMDVEKLIIGGELIQSEMITTSPIVYDALCDGIGTLKQKRFCPLKNKFKQKNEKRWKLIRMMGTKSLEEPCGVLMKGINEESEEMMWHFNGPVKEILNMCKYYYDPEGHKEPLYYEMTQKIVKANQNMEHENELITIAFACTMTQDVGDLILIALVGMRIMKKEHTNAQIKELRERQITTVIVSTETLPILHDIAHKCEVLINGESESLVITGEVFRNYTDKERLEKVENIRVLGDALPSDKLLLVDTMRKKGEVVAYLGQTTYDAPSLKRANIGVTMGTRSSKHAIENCDIITKNESFRDLISMVDSGKCIYHNIQSFLQLVMNTTISCTFISFIEIAAFGDASLTSLQLSWVNFAVCFLGGLALLTKPLTHNLATSVSFNQSVLTAEMTRNILFQVSYLVIISLIIQIKGPVEDVGPNHYNKTMASNIIIFCQFFNVFVVREQQKKNFFKGIHRHREFWVAIVVCICLHIIIVMVQDVFDYGTRLKWELWVGCVLLGMLSWLVDWVGKCISGFIIVFFKKPRHFCMCYRFSFV